MHIKACLDETDWTEEYDDTDMGVSVQTAKKDGSGRRPEGNWQKSLCTAKPGLYLPHAHVLDCQAMGNVIL